MELVGIMLEIDGNGCLNLMGHCESRSSKVVEMVVEWLTHCIPLLQRDPSRSIQTARCSSMQMERSRNTTIPQPSSALGDHCNNVMTEQPGSYRSYHEVHFLGHQKSTKDSALDILREFADVRLSIYETPMPQVELLS